MDFDDFVNSELKPEVGSTKKALKRKSGTKTDLNKKSKNGQSDAEHNHREQLSRLATTDPAFYAFLQETDKELLNFGGKVKQNKAVNGSKPKSKALGKASKGKTATESFTQIAPLESDASEEQENGEESTMSVEEQNADNVESESAESEPDFEPDLDLQSSDDEDDFNDEDIEIDEVEDRSHRNQSEQAIIVNGSMIDAWSTTLSKSTEPDASRIDALRGLLSAFVAAVSNATGSEESVAHDDDDDEPRKKKRGKKRDDDTPTNRKSTRELDSLRKRDAVSKRYRVIGNELFNKTVSTCLNVLPIAFVALFDMESLAKKEEAAAAPKRASGANIDAKKKSRTTALRGIGGLAELYCAAVTDLLAYLGDTQTQCAVMRHALRITTLFAAFPRRLRVLARNAARIWSMGDEPCRVLAFLIVHRAVKLSNADFAEFCFKRMYLAFVRNCKFTSAATLGCTRFMQRCVVELFACNWTLAFRYAFIYTRQLAVFLRNALCQNDQRSASKQKATNVDRRSKKRQRRGADHDHDREKTTKDSGAMRKCASWQFIHSVTLWARLTVAASQRGASNQFELLVYPLVELANGLIRLCDAPAYYPLRIHLVRVLTTLASGTGRFVPALAPLLAVLSAVDLNRRCVANQSSSKKPLNFACTLRLSTGALRDRRAFLDGLVDELNDALLENLAAHAHRIDFPEYATPFVVELRAVLKRLRVAAYERSLRQTFEKVKQTCLQIRERRAAVDEHTSALDLTDSNSIERWNTHSKSVGTPLQTYFLQHRKTREVQLRMMLANAADRERGEDDQSLEEEVVQPRAKPLATEDDRRDLSALFDRFYFDELDRPVEEASALASQKQQTTEGQSTKRSKNKKKRRAEKNQQKVTKENGNSSTNMFTLDDLPNFADTVD